MAIANPTTTKKIATLTYTERATDHWSGDSVTCVDIDRDKAIEIIEFLKRAFDL